MELNIADTGKSHNNQLTHEREKTMKPIELYEAVKTAVHGDYAIENTVRNLVDNARQIRTKKDRSK